jgi:23S rRNA (adenine2503-C2)-methyltransferase
MGMGEPFANLPAVTQAVRILCHPAGLGLSPRRITVSTSGLLSELDEFAALPQAVRPVLAVSLNAATDELRRFLMPKAHRYSLFELRRALERFPLRVRERITIEYVLLQGVNDSAADARKLAEFVDGFRHHINLIAYNEFYGGRFAATADETIDEFARNILAVRPTLITVRRSRGRDIKGACGQLVRNSLEF